MQISPRRLLARLPMLLLLAVAACGHGGGRLNTSYEPRSSYPVPGPPEDPWGPYIQEASARYAVPERWVRAVMQQESGGHEYLHGRLTTSDAGAAGLMQLMPDTYAELRDRYGLGPDIYDPHDNIMAGTAYISELYARYGTPGFLIAYNAGPHRMDQYLAGGGIPNETADYVASLAPLVGGGPAVAPQPRYAAATPAAGGCWHDPDRAYDPTAPCEQPPPVAAAPLPQPQYAATTPRSGLCWRDPNKAYDPTAPCEAPPPVEVAAAPPPQPQYAAASPRSSLSCWHDPNKAYDPGAPCEAPPSPTIQLAAAIPPAPAPRPASHFSFIPAAQAEPVPLHFGNAPGWGVQVGAFSRFDQAQAAVVQAQRMAPELARARPSLSITQSASSPPLYRARLVGVSEPAAASACNRLTHSSWACLTVPPGS